jgi:hypothetical protein
MNCLSLAELPQKASFGSRFMVAFANEIDSRKVSGFGFQFGLFALSRSLSLRNKTKTRGDEESFNKLIEI